MDFEAEFPLAVLPDSFQVNEAWLFDDDLPDHDPNFVEEEWKEVEDSVDTIGGTVQRDIAATLKSSIWCEYAIALVRIR